MLEKYGDAITQDLEYTNMYHVEAEPDPEMFTPGHYIKVNFPKTEEGYIEGAGEGCYCIIDKYDKEAYDMNAHNAIIEGVLDNVCSNYKGLNPGQVVPIELRGDKRPVVPYSWLVEHFEAND